MSTTDQESEELFEHYNFTADPGQELLRIDKYLMLKIPKTSRSKIQQVAKDGHIIVNGKAIKPNYKVHPHDKISVVLSCERI